MYITQEYKKENDYNSDDKDTTIDPDKLKQLKHKARKVKNKSDVLEK